jgi:uncharacterized cupin superfamily protein
VAAVRKFDPAIRAQEYRLPSEKRLSGDPLQRVWNQYTDASGKFSAGTWSSEVGKWRITYTEEEYCRILQGISLITDDSGHSVTVSAGDELVIPRGFEGTWEVIEPTHKVYVIYEAGV